MSDSTVVFEDGSTESYPRVAVKDGFIHCFKRVEPLDRDNFNSSWEYWLVRVSRSMMLAFQSRYYHEKSVPESRVTELRNA